MMINIVKIKIVHLIVIRLKLRQDNNRLQLLESQLGAPMGREYRVPRRRILRTELKLEEEDYAKTATKL